MQTASEPSGSTSKARPGLYLTQVMAALILNNEDDAFGQLLNDAERGQLQSFVNLALDRYEQQTNPPNKLGRLLAGCIKK